MGASFVATRPIAATSSKPSQAPTRRPPEEHLRVLSEAMRAFAEATTDMDRLLEAVARGVAEVVKDYCIVTLLSDDGQTVKPVAMFDPDPEALRQVNDTFSEPVNLATHPVSRRVLESGEPFFAPHLDLEQIRPPRTTARYFEFIRRIGIHSLLIVALRVHDRSIGLLTLARYRPESPPFDQTDLDLVQNLASHAALAIANARLLAEARRERAEGRRVADRLRILTEAAREFSVATYDLDRLLDTVARRLGELVGDMCVIRPVSEDGAWLESTGAAYHRDPDLLAATRASMSADRQSIGEGISGRVAATGKALITRTIKTSDFIASSEPRYAPILERLAITSSMTLPLICQGKVVGVANLMRGGVSPPYEEDDLILVQGFADHAALALGNARSFAAERAARDVAEQATRALRVAEARFARLSECGIVGIVVASLDSRILEANDTLLAMVGYSRDEILSGRVVWKDLTPPEWREVDEQAVAELTTSGVGGLREKEYIRKDGKRVPVLIGSAMLEGERRECISFVLDLTDRHQAQAAIAHMRADRAADTMFRGLLESAPDAMVVVAEDGAIALVNRQVQTLFGYTPAELIGQPVETLLPERFRGGHPAHRAEYLRNSAIRPMGAAGALYGRRKDGTEFPIEVRLSPFKTDHGLLVSSAIRDITVRRKAEQQRDRLAAIVDASDDAIVGKTLDGVITSWNRGAERMFGYTAEDIVGKSITLLVPPGLEDEERMILQNLARGEVMQLDTVRRRKDGRKFDVSVTLSPVRDAAGQVVGISKVARDITERKRGEEALATAKAAADAANSELEAFSYSVAHDLRAPLRGMNGFAQVLLDAYRDKFDAEGQDWLQEILLNAKKMGALIDSLLSLSRVTRSELKRESVDLSALGRAAAARFHAAEPLRAVEVTIQDHLRADLDPALARALIENLLGNAWKFTSKVAAARIELGVVEKDGSPAFFVRDNGAGFDMAFAKKLFSAFQRLHSADQYPGTGIGLATVQRIVRRHGGRTWAEGTVNGGATFYFTCPARTSGVTQ